MKIRTFDHNGSTSDTVTGLEIINRSVARKAAAAGLVLLKNDGILPLKKGSKVALFGAGATNTVKGGTGSGDVNVRDYVTIAQGMQDAGFNLVDQAYLENYKKIYTKARADWKASILEGLDPSSDGFGEAVFERYSANAFVFPDGPEITAEDLTFDAASDKTAIYVISRIAGEGADRHLTKGDYYLTDGEKRDLLKLSELNARIIVLINAGGAIDMSDILGNTAVSAILFISQPGQEGGHAVADVLSGDVTPSGKLTATWAQKYSDYPCSDTFGSQNGNTDTEYYQEGIYVGYRYFTTFGKKPVFPFGFGLSYTDFDYTDAAVKQINNPENEKEHLLEITVTVANAGKAHSGKETIEVYALLPQERLAKERERLIGFAKTDELDPDEEQTVTIYANAKSLASYDAEKSAWILEKGIYGITVGASSADLQLAGTVEVKDDFLVEQDQTICPLEPDQKDKLIEITPDAEASRKFTEGWTEAAASSGISHIIFVPTVEMLPEYKEDEIDRKARELAQKLPAEDYIPLLYGEISQGQGALGNAAVHVPGAAGETSNAFIETLGIPGAIMADGPAGLRLQQQYEVNKATGKSYPADFVASISGDPSIGRHENTELYYQYCTAFPVGTLLAQTWDTDLVEEVGKAVALELDRYHVSWWLAPGMNIQRNPLCGRNFEYYSEDPVVAGEIAAAMTRGVQSKNGVGTTIKHFACNNQEDNRMGVDDVIGERALREIYLRGFEIAVKESQPMALMTSYNKINGVHSANNKDIITEALRNEWGFKGLVMTDWTTTFTGIGGSDSAKCPSAGNDLIMPGYPGDDQDIREAFKNGTLSEDDIRSCAERLINIILRSSCFEDAKPYSTRFEQ